MQSLAFPLRLEENGLLRRDERIASLLSLLQVMARTPAGSWAGSPQFGLRDLFENGRQRADVARLAMERINAALADLGLAEFVVLEVVREFSGQREVDTYAITLTETSSAAVVKTVLAASS